MPPPGTVAASAPDSSATASADTAPPASPNADSVSASSASTCVRQDTTPQTGLNARSKTDAVRFVDSAESVDFRTANGKAARAGAELRIQLLCGGLAVFRDNTTPSPEFALWRYAGYLKSMRSHVVHRIPMEGSGAYLVVDDSTGDQTIVFGMPVASPDGKRFALTSMAGEANYDAGLIEVWRMEGRKPEQEFSYDTGSESWEASDAVWRDSVTIDFLKNSHSVAGDPYVQKPGRLTRTGTTWALSDK